jgi:acetyl esterase
MKLDDAVRTFLSTKPDSGSPDQPIDQRRALIRAGSDSLFDAFGAPVDDVYARDEVELLSGGTSIRARVYRPNQAAGLPIHIFLHGGGFWLGSIDERVNDAMCRQRSREAGCLVIAVEYRLAPEHRFPAPVEDCYAALAWAVEHADDLGGDPDNISIGGVSAGANLAAAVALAARDRQGPRLRAQVLEVPPLDLTLDTMRACEVGDEYGISVDEMDLARGLYLRSPEDARDPLASPLLAPDLTGLPPAWIMTAEFDPLRLDGQRYAARLRDAGVQTSHRTYPGAVHGSLALTGNWSPARTWQHDVVEVLREAHKPGRVASPSLPSQY